MQEACTENKITHLYNTNIIEGKESRFDLIRLSRGRSQRAQTARATAASDSDLYADLISGVGKKRLRRKNVTPHSRTRERECVFASLRDTSSTCRLASTCLVNIFASHPIQKFQTIGADYCKFKNI
jgi:hypothetical protein